MASSLPVNWKSLAPSIQAKYKKAVQARGGSMPTSSRSGSSRRSSRQPNIKDYENSMVYMKNGKYYFKDTGGILTSSQVSKFKKTPKSFSKSSDLQKKLNRQKSDAQARANILKQKSKTRSKIIERKAPIKKPVAPKKPEVFGPKRPENLKKLQQSTRHTKPDVFNQEAYNKIVARGKPKPKPKPKSKFSFIGGGASMFKIQIHPHICETVNIKTKNFIISLPQSI